MRKGEKEKCIKMHGVVWLRWENTTVSGKGQHYTMVRYRWLKDAVYKQEKTGCLRKRPVFTRWRMNYFTYLCFTGIQMALS